MLAHDPEERPTLEKLKAHPWITAAGSASDIQLKQEVAEKIMKMREEKREERKRSAQAVGGKQYKRGADDGEEAYISNQTYTRTYEMNTLTEWGTTLKAAEFWEKFEE